LRERQQCVALTEQAYDAVSLMRRAGLEPDPWQIRVATTPGDQLLLCHRQAGKSTIVAAIALADALETPGALILLVSPSLRQSSELYRKTKHFYNQVKPMRLLKDTEHEMELENGSRIISLPASAETLVGYSSVKRLIPDEAARVADATYHALRPMLAMSGGSILALSTPFGKRGWYYEAWEGSRAEEQPLDVATVNSLLADLGIRLDEASEPETVERAYGWTRTKLTGPENTRLSKRFLAHERRSIPDLYWRSEWLCEFVDNGEQIFTTADLMAMLSGEVVPLFGAGDAMVEDGRVVRGEVAALDFSGSNGWTH
jgi:hypothetical protein